MLCLVWGKWRCITCITEQSRRDKLYAIETDLNLLLQVTKISQIKTFFAFFTSIFCPYQKMGSLSWIAYCNPRYHVAFYSDGSLWYLQEFLVITDRNYLVVIVINCYPGIAPYSDVVMQECDAMEYKYFQVIGVGPGAQQQAGPGTEFIIILILITVTHWIRVCKPFHLYLCHLHTLFFKPIFALRLRLHKISFSLN